MRTYVYRTEQLSGSCETGELTTSPNSEGPHAAPAKELSALAPQLKVITPALMDALSALEAEAFGAREVKDLFYVSHLGISPAAQGKGVGTALCEYIVRRGREAGVAVSLVTMSERHVSVLAEGRR